MGNPEALAEAIRTLAGDGALRQRIADGGYEIFRQRFTSREIAKQLAPVIQEAACASAS
jgi:glycosyltransferase involved in cell wall biosynthesis